ncbi:hypothetical protein EON66_03665 [archaeon]|nr:MAG: hypothetical protein EON66_03665 [archaeon]
MQTKAKVVSLEQELEETDAYRFTLDYMLDRCRKAKVETTALQKAFEEALTSNSHELELKQSLLQSVNKGKEEEFIALQALQLKVKEQVYGAHPFRARAARRAHTCCGTHCGQGCVRRLRRALRCALRCALLQG